MHRPTLRQAVPVLAAALLVGLLVLPVRGGPPAICHELDIGSAPIPKIRLDRRLRNDADRTKFARDVVRVLDTAEDPVVHMELLRRVAMYGDDQPAFAIELIARLTARLVETGDAEPHAWLDAGYFVQCCDQVGLKAADDLGARDGIAGYAWLTRAIALDGDEPAYEMAAAVATCIHDGALFTAHRDRAATLAKTGSSVASNLEKNRKHWAYLARHAERRAAR